MRKLSQSIIIVLFITLLTGCFKTQHFQILNLTPHQLVENQLGVDLMLISEKAPDSLVFTVNQQRLSSQVVDEAQWGAQWKGQAHLWGHSVEFPSSLSGQVLLQVSAYAQDQMIASVEVPIEVVLPKTINPQYTPEQISEIENFCTQGLVKAI